MATLTITRIAHSSVLIDFDGHRVLTDPWFSEKFGMAIFRLRNGQIVEEWLVTDQLSAMQRIGGIEGWRQTP